LLTVGAKKDREEKEGKKLAFGAREKTVKERKKKEVKSEPGDVFFAGEPIKKRATGPRQDKNFKESTQQWGESMKVRHWRLLVRFLKSRGYMPPVGENMIKKEKGNSPYSQSAARGQRGKLPRRLGRRHIHFQGKDDAS